MFEHIFSPLFSPQVLVSAALWAVSTLPSSIARAVVKKKTTKQKMNKLQLKKNPQQKPTS